MFEGLLDYQAMKTALLPRVKKLCINTNLLSVRVNALICIGKLLQHLDKWIVLVSVEKDNIFIFQFRLEIYKNKLSGSLCYDINNCL